MPKLNIVATTLAGLEGQLEKEIQELGGENIRKYRRAVSFSGSMALLYKLNFSLRTALRILYKLKTFPIKTEADLYKNVYKIPWEDYFSNSKTIAVKSVVNTTLFRNTHYVALKTKDAIVDRMRDKSGNRPNVSLTDPDILINIHINKNWVDISLDSSGAPLYKRGYREEGFEAPLNEVLAAGMILITGWNGDSDFIDPMCGSATLPIEAAMIARNIPPGVFRASFGFQNWRDYDEDLYNRIVEELMVSKNYNYKLCASDISVRAVEAARKNIRKALLEDVIELKHIDFFKTSPGSDRGMVIINPPYGERVKQYRINDFYKRLGDHLKFKYSGHTAWILSANFEALKLIGLKPSEKISLMNGNMECKYNKYELFSGKRSDFLTSD